MGDAVRSVTTKSLCPESEMRDAMDDGAFWEWVFHRGEMPDQEDDYEPDVVVLTPCPECGEIGPCAYDAEGRALIHLTDREDEVSDG